MSVDKEFFELYRTFIIEVNLLSKLDSDQFARGSASLDSNIRFMMLDAAARVKTQQISREQVPNEIIKLSEKIEIVDSKDSSYTLTSSDPMTRNLLSQFDKRRQEIEKYGEYAGTFKITNLTNLIEATLTSLTAWSLRHFEAKSKKFQTGTIKIQDLERFSSIDAARDFALERYVNDLTYKGAKEWVVALADILDPQIRGDSNFQRVLDNVVELYLRRNLLVHNSGIVNSIYLDSLPASVSRDDLKMDDQISADDEYLIEVFETSIELVNIFFKSRLTLVVEQMSEDPNLSDFIWEMNNLGSMMYEQNHFLAGTHFYRNLSNISKEKLGEDAEETFFMYYNYYLGIALQGGLDSKMEQVTRLFKYTKSLPWWGKLGEMYTYLSENSLVLSKDEFSDVAVDFATKLNESGDEGKKNLIAILEWPMMKLADDKGKWTKFVNSLYPKI